jgi:hypothetical protein
MTVSIDPGSIAVLQSVANQWQAGVNTLNALIASTTTVPVPVGSTSPSGTTIIAPTTATITDATGRVWSLQGTQPISGYGYTILVNGNTYFNGIADKLVIDKNGVVWQLNGEGLWFVDNGAGFNNPVGGNSVGPVT